MFKCEKCGSTKFEGCGTYSCQNTYKEKWDGDEQTIEEDVPIQIEWETGECVDRNLHCSNCGDGNMNWVD